MTSTTVAPVGVASMYDKARPIRKATIETRTEVKTTPLKFFARRIAVRVGKMMRLEMRSEPRRRIPSTTVQEQMAAKIAS